VQLPVRVIDADPAADAAAPAAHARHVQLQRHDRPVQAGPQGLAGAGRVHRHLQEGRAHAAADAEADACAHAEADASTHTCTDAKAGPVWSCGDVRCAWHG
jgi:hypothetical protein